MLRKDKALLESLTRKYGKKELVNLINEKKELAHNNLIKKYKFIEKELKRIFDHYGINEFELEDWSDLPTVYINNSGVKFENDYKCVGFARNEMLGDFYIIMTNGTYSYDLPLEDIDYRIITNFYNWFVNSKDEIIAHIEETLED